MTTAIKQNSGENPRQPGQLPSGDHVYLDHVGHFVADAQAASRALERAGFAPTPISVQVNPDPAGGAPKPTGTGNVCAMLERGYLEVLFKTADTPLGREFDAARARYDGLHLAAFAIDDAAGQHARLEQAGFAMQPVVDMRRPVDTAMGPGIAAFSVVRLVAGQMPEGRIQVLRHHTEAEVWQPRWLAQPNSAVGLESLTIAVVDVAEAAQRYARFFGQAGAAVNGGVRFALDRGSVELVDADALARRRPGLAVPSLPFMAECGIAVLSLDAVAGALTRGGLVFARGGAEIVAPFPPELGQGVWVFSVRRVD